MTPAQPKPIREIKLRAWEPHAKKMHYGTDDLYSLVNALKLMEMPNEMKWMQFTGLRDSKGVEIYEGDVLDTVGDGYDKVKVWWNRRTAQFCGARNFTDEGLSHDDLQLTYFKHGAIIGNIYENPELLKV